MGSRQVSDKMDDLCLGLELLDLKASHNLCSFRDYPIPPS